MPLAPRAAVPVCAVSVLAAAAVHADRRYFVQSHTPYLAPAGNLELEVWANAAHGQGDSSGTAWENRAEFEYAINDRLTGSFYLNYVQSDGGAQRFDGPSLELIYALGERGAIPLDPAVYLEARENGSELELEPKLLLAQRAGSWLAVANLIGEFETFHSGPEQGEWEKALELTTGVTHEWGTKLALGLEAKYVRELADEAGNPSALFLGPTLNLQTTKLQLALGWQPQIWGDPDTHGGRNVLDFPRSEVRVILGIGL